MQAKVQIQQSQAVQAETVQTAAKAKYRHGIFPKIGLAP